MRAIEFSGSMPTLTHSQTRAVAPQQVIHATQLTGDLRRAGVATWRPTGSKKEK